VIKYRKQIEPASEAAAFTAADYIALERSVGNVVTTFFHNDRLGIGVEDLGSRQYPQAVHDAHLAGMRRFRAWQKVTPHWREQIASVLAQERAVDAVGTFTAKDWIAAERAFGHEVRCSRGESGRTEVFVWFLNQKPDASREARQSKIDELWKSRAWEDVTPDWADQVAAALDAEKAKEARK